MLVKKRILQIDTETDGLDFRKDKLRLVQIGTTDNRVYMVHHPDETSYWLAYVLTHKRPEKFFHHALFDLRFIKFWIGIEVTGEIECTKTLMKIIHPELPSGLANAIKNILGLKLKQPRVDYRKWKENKLTEKHKAYAADDVLYLYSLGKQLHKELPWKLVERYDSIMQGIQAIVNAQVEGFEDVFDYPQDKEALSKREAWEKRWEALPPAMKDIALQC